MDFPYWRGGVRALSAHFPREGHPNACRMRAGGGRGSKKAKKLRAHFMYGPFWQSDIRLYLYFHILEIVFLIQISFLARFQQPEIEEWLS